MLQLNKVYKVTFDLGKVEELAVSISPLLRAPVGLLVLLLCQSLVLLRQLGNDQELVRDQYNQQVTFLLQFGMWILNSSRGGSCRVAPPFMNLSNLISISTYRVNELIVRRVLLNILPLLLTACVVTGLVPVNHDLIVEGTARHSYVAITQYYYRVDLCCMDFATEFLV